MAKKVKSHIIQLVSTNEYWSTGKPSNFERFLKGEIITEDWTDSMKCAVGDIVYCRKTTNGKGAAGIIAYGVISKIGKTSGTQVLTIDFVKIFDFNDPSYITTKYLNDTFKEVKWDVQGRKHIENDDTAQAWLDECNKIQNCIIIQEHWDKYPQVHGNSIPQTNSSTKHPLNLILYGPPGTGKTYKTINEALAIIEGKRVEDIQKENRNNVLGRFNKLKDDGQIVFTTFHQSLSYEEFIEGIKPIPDDSALVAKHSNQKNISQIPQFGNGRTAIENLVRMKYEVRPGIFKQLCEVASENATMEITEQVTKTVTKTPLAGTTSIPIDKLLDQFIKKVEAKEIPQITINGVVYDISKEVADRSIQAKRNGTNVFYSVTCKTIKRDWGDFKEGKIKSADGIRGTRQGKHGGKNEKLSTRNEHWAIYNALKELEDELLKSQQQSANQDTELPETITEIVPKNYVLIIDEINRGNVSQIFGELITLIEEDKRTTKLENGKYVDNPEKITVKLPYSPGDKPFGVPGNLYIIGTMNTADRSVEALDTALRRRFEFKEMMPKPELATANICGYSLKEILETINNRIRVLKDREHQIGHSYFMNCSSEAELKNVFKNKIVPLLQEYFYGNYAQIGMVLGDEFVKLDTEANNPSFATFDGNDLFNNDADKKYKLLDEDGWENLNMQAAIDKLMGK